MALRIQKTTFKPTRPLKGGAPVRRPPVATPSSSQPLPAKVARPAIATSSAPETAPPSTAPAAATTTTTPATPAATTETPAPTAAPVPKASPASPEQPKQTSPKHTSVRQPPTPISIPTDTGLPPSLLPSAVISSDPKSAVSDDARKHREDSVASDLPPPTPSAAASPSPATTPRGPRKAKPLLAAAAASKTPTQRGTLREREKLKRQERAERERLREESHSLRFTPTPRHSPAPGTPTSTWFPPTVATSTQDATQTTKSPTQQTTQAADGWPHTAATSSAAISPSASSLANATSPVAVLSDFPPAVAPVAPADTVPGSSSSSTPDPAALTAALASIKPKAPSAPAARKRQVRKKDTPDTDDTPTTSPKRRRTTRAARQDTAEVEDDNESILSDGSGKPSTAKRQLRGRYGTRGKAGTTQDRRTNAFKRQAVVAQPELPDGVEPNQLVGQEVNETVMTMGDLATSLANQGRVSARTIKLAQFQRAEEERKLRERAVRTERNWRRRQVVRRKARELRNNQRADRREAARARGEDPDAISADEIDSDEDYEVEPDRLTPPGSPRQAERVAPVSFEPQPEAPAAEDTAEPSENPAEQEDIEGLGFTANDQQSEMDDEFGETIENFQLPVDEDPAGDSASVHDFSGLEYNDYTGGYLDDEGNWVEGGSNHAAMIHQRNEERRRRLMEGDHGQAVELIDNDTQFINSATWGKKVANDRWTAEETELFFAVLRETGENYTLMKAYFPGRTVRQLKNKGSRENRINPQRMTDAIMNRRPMDKEYLAKSSGFNIDRPYDRENAFLEEVAKEKERIVAGLLPIADELEVQTTSGWDASDALEFVQVAN